MNNITFFLGGLSNGGAERVVCNLASYLVQSGHQVEILTMSDAESPFYLDERVSKFALIKKDERHGFLFNSVVRFKRFCKYLLNHKTDAYVVMLPTTIELLLSFHFLTNAKIIASERNFPGAYSKSIQRKLKCLSRNADAWIFQTEAVKDWYGKRIRKSAIIPNPLNSKFVVNEFNGVRSKKIVTAGRLTEAKKHLLLIDSFAKIAFKYQDYKLIIYGKGDLEDILKDKINQLGLSSQIILAGFSKDLSKDIQDASLFVLSSDFEGMPNVLMEAMALGVPCVSTDCDGGGAKFLIDNNKNGLLVPKGDSDALAEAMDRMLSNPDFAEAMGKEAHKICERLDPVKINSEWELFIQDIINTK